MSAPRPVGTAPDSPPRDEGAAREHAPVRGRRRRRWLPVLLLLAALAALAAWGGTWLHSRWLYVHETDARVGADMIAVGTRVEGWVTAVDVREGDGVKAGQRLAHIDSRAAVLQLQELKAELASLRAEHRRVEAQRVMVDEQTRSRLRSTESELSAAQALAESLEYEARLATAEFERASTLSKTGVVSANELDRARTAYQRAKQELLSAQAQAASARAKMAEMQAQRQELAVLDAEAEVLDTRRRQQEARVDRQALVVADHDVLASTDGVISRVFVEAGEFLRLGQRVALLHDPSNIWVEANVRETEIGRVRIGQPVRIAVDAYPDLPLRGRVERIGQATTGEFALLPTPNPSGNFTKVTQRLPVRIAVAQRDGVLRPGMLVEIDIDVAAP